MARTTPAQKPRGFNKNKVLGSVFTVMIISTAALAARLEIADWRFQRQLQTAILSLQPSPFRFAFANVTHRKSWN
jgi:hypothetical protein